MDFIDSSLSRLLDSVKLCMAPSDVLSDIRQIQMQIALRQQVLRDIEVVRCRLSVSLPNKGERPRRDLQRRRRQRNLAARQDHVWRASRS